MQHECPHCGGKIETKVIRREIRGENWRILEGDALNIMREMDAASIDGVITDPPYGSGAFTAADRLKASTDKYASGNGGKDFPEIACDSIPPDTWQTLMQDTMTQTSRLLRNGGLFAFFIDWRGIGQLSSFAAIAGLRPRGVAVWHKTGGVRPYKGGIAQSAEFILWGTKGKIIQRDVYIKGVFNAPNLSMARRRHLTEKPVDVLRELMPLVPGDVVLDPFAGSASTGEERYYAANVSSVSRRCRITWTLPRHVCAPSRNNDGTSCLCDTIATPCLEGIRRRPRGAEKSAPLFFRKKG